MFNDHSVFIFDEPRRLLNNEESDLIKFFLGELIRQGKSVLVSNQILSYY